MADGCSPSEQYIVSILAEGETIHSTTFDWQSTGMNLMELVPDASLQPNTTYELTIEASDGWEIYTAVSFTTGEGLVEGISGKPSGTMESVIIYDEGQWGEVEATYSVVPVNDSDEVSVIIVYDEEDPEIPVHAFNFKQAENSQVALWSMESPFPTGLCLKAVQRDGKGDLSELSAPFCVPVDIVNVSGICSCASSTQMVWFTPLLALFVLRRRQYTIQESQYNC